MTDDAQLRTLDISAAIERRPPYGIVDIGSNSVRLVVYDQLGRAPLPRFNEKSLCRLGEGLAETGAIRPDNFRRTVEATRRFAAIAEAMHVAELDVTATEAIRRAVNGPELVAAIERESGLKVRVLAGHEEAYYATLGVISAFYRPVGSVGDMGGGSLEVALALDDRVGEVSVSLPLGALPVEAMLAAGREEAKREVDERLRAGLPMTLSKPTFYAVGGGWRALAKAHMAVARAPVRVTHGYALTTAEARDFAKSIWRAQNLKPGAALGVQSRRARSLPSAALALDRVLKRLAPERVVFSALGLREGLLYSKLPREEQYRDPLVEGARLIGLQAARVPEFAAALADWTATLFPGETMAETRLRVAACALSDMAWRDAPELRAEETFRRVLQFPFIGVDHPDRAFLAAACHFRYDYKSDAPWLEPAIRLIGEGAKRRARILGCALRLAYRFSGASQAVLSSAGLKIDGDRLVLEIAPAARAPDSEVVAERLKWLAGAMGLRGGVVEEREVS
jgi:exopolyphosphatase/guanosine-5'-triphosphate,3'-diphosphate pyrophosphatase